MNYDGETNFDMDVPLATEPPEEKKKKLLDSLCLDHIDMQKYHTGPDVVYYVRVWEKWGIIAFDLSGEDSIELFNLPCQSEKSGVGSDSCLTFYPKSFIVKCDIRNILAKGQLVWKEELEHGQQH